MSIPSLLVILLLVRAHIPTLRTLTPNRPSNLLPQILPHDPIHTAYIVSRLAHIVQLRPPRPLLLPLHNLNALNVGTVDLKPHLDSNPRELVAEEDGSVDGLVALANVEADAGERIARF